MTLQTVGYIGNNVSYDNSGYAGMLYAAQGSQIRVYDTSDSYRVNSLQWYNYIHMVETGSLIRSVRVISSGGKSYLCVVNVEGIVICDLTNPSYPSPVGWFTIVGNVIPSRGIELRDACQYGSYLYITAQNAGVVVLNINNVKSISYVTTLKLAGNNRPRRITRSGFGSSWSSSTRSNVLFVACEIDNRLDAIDVSNPTHPRVIGSWSSNTGTNSFSGVAVNGNYVYVSEYYNGIHVLDSSNPSSMREVTNYMGINANDIYIANNYLFVSVRYWGLYIFDISNPSVLKLVGMNTQRTGYYEGIRVLNPNTVALSNDTFGVEMFDISNISNPYYMNSVTVIPGVDSLAGTDNCLYLGGHNQSIWTMYLWKGQLSEYGPTITSGRFPNIKVQGNYLFAAGDWRPVVILDVSTPYNPRVLFDPVTSSNAQLVDGLLPDPYSPGIVYTSVYYPVQGLGVLDATKLPDVYPTYISVTDFGASNARFAKVGANTLLMASAHGKNKGLLVIDVSNISSPRLITTLFAGSPCHDVKVVPNTTIAYCVTTSNLYVIDLSRPSYPSMLSNISYPGTWSIYCVEINPVTHVVYAAGNQLRSFNATDPTNLIPRDTISLQWWPAYDLLWFNNYLFVADYKYGVFMYSDK